MASPELKDENFTACRCSDSVVGLETVYKAAQTEYALSADAGICNRCEGMFWAVAVSGVRRKAVVAGTPGNFHRRVRKPKTRGNSSSTFCLLNHREKPKTEDQKVGEHILGITDSLKGAGNWKTVCRNLRQGNDCFKTMQPIDRLGGPIVKSHMKGSPATIVWEDKLLLKYVSTRKRKGKVSQDGFMPSLRCVSLAPDPCDEKVPDPLVLGVCDRKFRKEDFGDREPTEFLLVPSDCGTRKQQANTLVPRVCDNILPERGHEPLSTTELPLADNRSDIRAVKAGPSPREIRRWVRPRSWAPPTCRLTSQGSSSSQGTTFLPSLLLLLFLVLPVLRTAAAAGEGRTSSRDWRPCGIPQCTCLNTDTTRQMTCSNLTLPIQPTAGFGSLTSAETSTSDWIFPDDIAIIRQPDARSIHRHSPFRVLKADAPTTRSPRLS